MLTEDQVRQKTPKDLATLLSKLFREKQSLQDEKQSLEDEKSALENHNDLLRQKLNALLQRQYGCQSEKSDHLQAYLFDEIEVGHDAQQEEMEAVDEGISITVPEHHRKKGRKGLPKRLPRVQHIHDLPDDEKICGCGCTLTQIGDVRSEQLEFIPATVQVIEHIRLKYACKRCEDTIKLAKKPAQPIPKSIATPGLLSHVLVSKFADHLPFYRQESIFRRMGIDIVRGTMCSWASRCADLLKPLVKKMHREMLRYDIGYADETTVQVLKEAGRKVAAKSYMWVFVGGPLNKRSILYEYHPSRAHSIPDAFWEGFSGYLHTDGYGGYSALFKKRALTDKKMQGVHCFAHARRKFVDIIKTTKKATLANQAVKQIAELYKFEKLAKQKSYDADQIYQLRQKQSLPRLSTLKQWLDDHVHQVLPKSPIGNAIEYCIKFWDNLVRYTEDGRLEIDNNLTERAVKPFVMGRKAWLFHDNPKGAQAGAIIYSLIATCKAHDVEPYAYLRAVLTHIVHTETESDVEKLLPYNIDKSLLKIRE